MKRLKKYFMFPLTIILLSRGCYKEEIIDTADLDDPIKIILKMNGIPGYLDEKTRTVFFTLPESTSYLSDTRIIYNSYHSMSLNGISIESGKSYDLGEVRINKLYEIICNDETRVDTFQLCFSLLPLIHVSAEEIIRDEPKTLCRLRMQYQDPHNQDPVVTEFRTLAGLEIRGATSMKYAKVSYGLELWRNQNRDDYALSLLGMRTGEDWILDAMYIDPMRMRNKISFDLWNKLATSSHNPDYENRLTGINSRFIELFINNTYVGLYNLDEKIDENLLDISKGKTDHGSLYKANNWANGATRFAFVETDPPAGFFWDGWELIYPDQFPYWQSLNDLRKMVVHSSDQDFSDSIDIYLDLDNALSYYLFMNLLLASDNAGKNTYLFQPSKNSPFQIIPWDIEASWGIAWNGMRMGETGIPTNHLFDRLIELDVAGFKSNLGEKWNDLRTGMFSSDSLIEPINRHFSLLSSSGAIQREYNKWRDDPEDAEEEYQYIIDWIDARLEYLDTWFQ